MLVLDDAIDFASFVPFRQVLCDRKTFRITEEHSMAVLVLLHLVAGADPRALLRLFRLVLVEVAGAQRLADLVDVLGEADDEKLRDLALWMQVRAALLGEALDELPHLLDVLRRSLLAIFVAGLFDGHADAGVNSRQWTVHVLKV